jgi:hypothetical protein
MEGKNKEGKGNEGMVREDEEGDGRGEKKGE